MILVQFMKWFIFLPLKSKYFYFKNTILSPHPFYVLQYLIQLAFFNHHIVYLVMEPHKGGNTVHHDLDGVILDVDPECKKRI